MSFDFGPIRSPDSMIGVILTKRFPSWRPQTPHAAIKFLRFMTPFSIDRAYILFQRALYGIVVPLSTPYSSSVLSLATISFVGYDYW